MSEFLKMDIFFVVATIASVVVALLFCAVLYYLARFLKTLDRIAGSIEEETDAIRKDIDEVRKSMKKNTVRANSLISLFGKTITRYLGRSKRK
jgi:uncharacterized protein YoxC